jgi:hypothetical protein
MRCCRCAVNTILICDFFKPIVLVFLVPSTSYYYQAVVNVVHGSDDRLEYGDLKIA